jgi:cytochrome c peroxidase
MKCILTILLLFTITVSITYGLGSCRKNANPNELTYLQQEIPAGFPAPAYTFRDNPVSEEGFQLGKKLFYDGRLSVDGVHPCSSCHQQIAAFGTYEHDRSHGVHSSHTLRNAPPLFNLAWQTHYHWDGEFADLFHEAAWPINGATEMGETFKSVVDKLQADEDYRRMFKQVFRTDFISPEDIMRALAQFTGSILSTNSKYDKVKKGQATFTVAEQNGYQLFQAHCATCHPEPMFTDNQFHNIGLPVDPFLNDFGRMRITQNRADSLKFKTPSLRNVYVTSNYMHDGRFNTLTQSINHYRTGVQPGPTLDPLLTGGISLTDAETVDLTLFLRAITDSSILNNPRYSQF